MGGDVSQKLLPWRGTHSSPGRSKRAAHGSPIYAAWVKYAREHPENVFLS